jgi:hypothetical protein
MSTVAQIETEQELVANAQHAISNCNWTVGECASKWTERFSKGRTDADFGALVGLSGDQIYQRRRVWETFGDVIENYPDLKWSHFYVAVTWTDSPEALAWASENQATVAEMKAWRRMQNGEDLTVESEAELALDDEINGLGFGDPIVTRTPEHFGESDGGRGTSDSLEESEASGNRVDAVKGEPGEAEPYAPYRKDAMSVPSSETSEGSSTTAPTMDSEQAFKRMTTAIERCNRLLTDDILDGFAELPEKLRIRFVTAVENLNDRVSKLS